jgi:acyl carrier protein
MLDATEQAYPSQRQPLTVDGGLTAWKETPMSATSTTDKVEQVIVDAIARFGPDAAEVTRDATFETLDVDSLDLVELAQIVEDEFGVKLEPSDVAELKTVGDVIDLVVARAS